MAVLFKLSIYCSGSFHLKCDFRGRCETLIDQTLQENHLPCLGNDLECSSFYLDCVLFGQFPNNAWNNELITATAVKTNVHITDDIVIWKSLDACSSASLHTSPWGIVAILNFFTTQSYSLRDTFTNLITLKHEKRQNQKEFSTHERIKNRSGMLP